MQNLMQNANNLDCHFLIILLIICKRTLLAVSFALKFTLMIQRSDTTEGTKGNSPGARRRYQNKTLEHWEKRCISDEKGALLVSL